MKNPVCSHGVNFQVAKGYNVTLYPITSLEEKAALEIQAINPENALDSVCKIYKIPENLNDDQKLACLLKVREISNGSDCTIKYKCPNCHRVSESIILLEDMLDFSNFDRISEFYKDSPFLKSAEFTDDVDFRNINNILNPLKYCKISSLDGLKLPEISEISTILKSRIPTLVDHKVCKCVLCQHERKRKITRDVILNSLSTYTLGSMYQVYHKLVINGFTKMDVDSMLPFERDVQIGLIDKRIEELKKNRANT